MTTPTQQAKARHTREESRKRIIAAATELIRDRSYAELNIGEIMERAGFGRTIFYRHFDDLGDLLLRAGREAIEELFQIELHVGPPREGAEAEVVRAAIEPAVAIFHRHGPLLRAMAEAAAGDEQVAAGHAAFRQRFDDLVVEALRELPKFASRPPAEIAEIARALNLLNTSYLLDAFGREPRVSAETAVRTLTEIWLAVVAE
jgi:TetR/AcrR family transcriptional regulator, ethionamide resistance regulator